MDPQFIVVDLFCGAGGTTTGFEMSGGIAKVIACINHDHKAIESHWMNHPDVEHFNEDITTLYGDVFNLNRKKSRRKRGGYIPLKTFKGIFFESPELLRLKKLVDLYRAFYPKAKLILWASLECTNFSRAKGGPKDADSRTLANHLDRYIYALQPEIIQIENVVEFMSWGPLNEKGTPVKKKKGIDWLRWKKHIDRIGYKNDWKELNSANFGAFTSRNRLFGMFVHPGQRFIWPEPTHTKNPDKTLSLFGSLQKWKAVREVLDLQDAGQSIFSRKKQLSDKTFERIYHGLIKFVAGGKNEFESFIIKWLSLSKDGSAKNCSKDLNGPCWVVTTQNRLGLATVDFLTMYNGKSKFSSTDSPCPVLPTKDRITYVKPFMMMDYTSPPNLNSIENPSNTIPVNPKSNLVTPFVVNYYSGGGQLNSVEGPSGALTTIPKGRVVTPVSFMSQDNSGNPDSKIVDLDRPSRTITGSGGKLNMVNVFLMNPQWFNNSGHDVSQPCFTLIARMDKAPPYLVEVEKGQFGIEVYPTDSKFMILIKEFMAFYGIVDIKMRMLKIQELKLIQGFPADYKLSGTQTDQKKFIGNSVVPQVVKSWVTALAA
jgi:DNA (cytosine-5)-methyltransferase 1